MAFLLWSGTAAATAFASSFWELYSLRLLLGVGESVVTPASLRWVRFNVEERRRGLAIGLYISGTKIGPAIAVPIATWLTLAFGWRQMFLILGVSCLLWLVPWLWLVRDDDRQLEQSAKDSLTPLPMRALLRTPLIRGIMLGTFCYSYFVYFSVTWLPAYFVESRDLPLNLMSLFTMFTFGGMAVIAALAGWAADRLIEGGLNPVLVRRGFIFAGF